MKRGIATQLFFSFSSVIILTISVLGLVLTYFTNYYFGNENTVALTKSAQTVMEAINRYVLQNDEGADDVLYDFSIIASSTDSIIHIMDKDEVYVACTNIEECDLDIKEKSGIEFLENLRKTNSTVDIEILEYVNEIGRYSVIYSLYDEQDNHIGFLEIISRTNALIIFVDTLSTIFILSAGFILVLTSVYSFFLTSKIVTPITEISKAAKAFSNGDFSARVTGKSGAKEIANLADTFNTMATVVENHEVSLSNFVANISHELRTPMTSIKGFVDGVLDGTIDNDNQTKYLTIVSDEIGRLARLTNSMLQMSKLEAGEYLINIETHNLWDTISAAAIAQEKNIEAKNIKIIGFEPKKIQIYADADITHQIVYNIFDNAVKFTPNNGTISLRVFEEKTGEYIILKIKNDGAGIPNEELPYIFDRFYKSDKSRSTNKSGSGIGLYIVNTLLQRSGGKIEVESVLGKYTEFSIYFPANPIRLIPPK